MRIGSKSAAAGLLAVLLGGCAAEHPALRSEVVDAAFVEAPVAQTPVVVENTYILDRTRTVTRIRPEVREEIVVIEPRTASGKVVRVRPVDPPRPRRQEAPQLPPPDRSRSRDNPEPRPPSLSSPASSAHANSPRR